MRRFVIRDCETKKALVINRIRIEFNRKHAAINYINTMQFGLNRFYELFDNEESKVVKYKW